MTTTYVLFWISINWICCGVRGTYTYNTYSRFNVQKSNLKIQIWLFMWRYFYMIFISEVFSTGISPYGCGGRRIVHACKDFNQFLIRPNKSRCCFSCFWLNTYKVQKTQNAKNKHAGNISFRVCMCLWRESQYGFNRNFRCLNT